jgi:hypothetical protein
MTDTDLREAMWRVLAEKMPGQYATVGRDAILALLAERKLKIVGEQTPKNLCPPYDSVRWGGWLSHFHACPNYPGAPEAVSNTNRDEIQSGETVTVKMDWS